MNTSVSTLRPLVLGVGLLGAASLQADILPTAGSPIISPSGPNFTYTYNVFLPSGSFVDDDSLFIVYDINGYVPGTAAFTPSGGAPTPTLTVEAFSPAFPNPFPIPPLVVPETALPNMKVEYGAAGTPFPAPVNVGDTALGTLTFDSTIGVGIKIGINFAAFSKREIVGGLISEASNYQQTVVPAPEMSAVLPISAAGLGALGFALWRRRPSRA
jgi:hypothetical protein